MCCNVANVRRRLAMRAARGASFLGLSPTRPLRPFHTDAIGWDRLECAVAQNDTTAKLNSDFTSEPTQRFKIRAGRQRGCTIRSTPARMWQRRTRIPSLCVGHRNTAWWRRACARAAASGRAHSVAVAGPSIAWPSRAPDRRHEHSRAPHFHRLHRRIQCGARIVTLRCLSLTVSLSPKPSTAGRSSLRSAGGRRTSRFGGSQLSLDRTRRTSGRVNGAEQL